MFSQAYAGMLPLQGTDLAAKWDDLYLFEIWLSIFFFILIVGGMIYFLYKYRDRPGAKARYITGNHLIEAIWTLIPLVLLLVIFGWGYYVYHGLIQAPSDAYEVRVIGKQWLWQFQYDDGRTNIGDLYVPINRPVKLVMTSEDVIHSFFVPNFRIKQDVVPGMYTSVWFEAKVPGKHQIFCAEYCGTSHSGMLGKVVVLTPEQWDAWTHGKKLGEIPDAGVTLDEVKVSQAGANSTARNVAPTESKVVSMVEQGKQLTQSKGCIACHSVDGSKVLGPTFKGLYGSTVELSDGKSVSADENYLRESIEKPQAKIVKGFSPVMPTFQGQVSEIEMNALIAYIKSVK